MNVIEVFTRAASAPTVYRGRGIEQFGEGMNKKSSERQTTSTSAVSVNEKSRAHVQRDIEMICAWVSFAALIVFNALAQAGILRKMVHPTHAEAFTWFVPARYVDLIWVVVYAFVAVWLVRLRNDKHREKGLGRIPPSILGILFTLTCLLQIAWLFCFHAVNYPATITLGLAATIVLWVLWFFSRKHDQTIWGWAPFSLWGSWMGIETITDIARAVSYYLSKNGDLSSLAQMASTIILAVLLLALACFARWHFHDWVFGLSALWALLGIAVRLMDTSKVTAVLIIVLETLAAALMYLPWRKLTGRLNSVDTVSAQTGNAVEVTDDAAADDTDQDDGDESTH